MKAVHLRISEYVWSKSSRLYAESRSCGIAQVLTLYPQPSPDRGYPHPGSQHRVDHLVKLPCRKCPSNVSLVEAATLQQSPTVSSHHPPRHNTHPPPSLPEQLKSPHNALLRQSPPLYDPTPPSQPSGTRQPTRKRLTSPSHPPPHQRRRNPLGRPLPRAHQPLPSLLRPRLRDWSGCQRQGQDHQPHRQHTDHHAQYEPPPFVQRTMSV